MDHFDIGYKWYIFRIYLNNNKIDFAELENIIGKRDKKMIKIFENILEDLN